MANLLDREIAAVGTKCTQCQSTQSCACMTPDNVFGTRGLSAPKGAAAPGPKSRAVYDPVMALEAGLDLIGPGGPVLQSLQPTLNPVVEENLTQAETIEELFQVARADQNYEVRRNIFEDAPGGFLAQIQGRYVNRVLGNITVPLAVNEDEDIFGQPETNVSSLRVDQANGFGPDIVNDFTYNASGTPGSARTGFIRDYFYITLGDACDHPWRRRIEQTTGNVRCEAQNMALYVNGMVGRTIYLVRRPEPYYFIMPNPRSYPPGVFPGNVCNFKTECNGFYFTTDPIGGSGRNTINGGVHPPIFPLSRLIRPNGNVYSIVVNNEWPSHLFYQSEHAPFAGSDVIVLGRYP